MTENTLTIMALIGIPGLLLLVFATTLEFLLDKVLPGLRALFNVHKQSTK